MALNTSCLNDKNNNSFIPSLKESERFISYLIDKFGLEVKEGFVITINKASKNAVGYFMPKEHAEHYTNTTQDLHNINLNTLYLKDYSPYEVLTHELAHFTNKLKGVKGTSSNGYHNKHFKAQAETFLLKVERTKKGYAHTTETEEFKKMLEEFKPQKEVFNIYQNSKDKKKKPTRLKKWVCSCGENVRHALRDSKGRDFIGICGYCHSNYEVEE